MTVARVEWKGNELVMRAQRALGRGIIGVGMVAVVAGKEHADVITGTMRRSIHLAPPGYATDDEAEAQRGEMPNQLEPTMVGTDWVIAVGSWVPYACVEEVGRGHQFMTPAVDVARGKTEGIMLQAFAEEGL